MEDCTSTVDSIEEAETEEVRVLRRIKRVDEYINTVQWSPVTTAHEKSLIAKHLRRFALHIGDAIDEVAYLWEPTTFERALALCPSVSLAQAKHWQKECQEDGGKTPWLDRLIALIESGEIQEGDGHQTVL